MTARGAVVVFSKVPRVGAVKTRLAAALGEAGAFRLYEAFLADTFARSMRVAAVVQARVVFAHAGPLTAAPAPDWLPPAVETMPQRGANLGERMDHAIRDAGGERVVLLGGDSPSMRDDRLLLAFAACDRGEAVLGPVDDGGYNVIGLPAPEPELFRDVAWSTPQVFETTVRRARAAGLPLTVLETAYDVDRPEDLARLAADPDLALAPRTAAVLAELADEH